MGFLGISTDETCEAGNLGQSVCEDVTSHEDVNTFDRSVAILDSGETIYADWVVVIGRQGANIFRAKAFREHKCYLSGRFVDIDVDKLFLTEMSLWEDLSLQGLVQRFLSENLSFMRIKPEDEDPLCVTALIISSEHLPPEVTNSGLKVTWPTKGNSTWDSGAYRALKKRKP